MIISARMILFFIIDWYKLLLFLLLFYSFFFSLLLLLLLLLLVVELCVSVLFLSFTVEYFPSSHHPFTHRRRLRRHRHLNIEITTKTNKQYTDVYFVFSLLLFFQLNV